MILITLKKIDFSNHFLIEMTVAMIAALKFREIKILKRKQIFSQGRLPFASNLNDATVKLLFQKHGD